jgi:hypothetical protein
MPPSSASGMLTGTCPVHLKGFCLDVHWVFRGCGDSQVALSDVLEQVTPNAASALVHAVTPLASTAAA